MAALSNQSGSLQNTVFASGYLYGTLPGSPAWTNDVLFGELENVSVNFDIQYEFLEGPEALVPIAAAAKTRKIQVTASMAKLRARTLMALLSGVTTDVASGSGNYLTSGTLFRDPGQVATDYGAKTFSLNLVTPSDGSDMEMRLYAVVPDTLKLDFALRKFVKPNWTATAIKDSVTGKVWDIFLPGSQLSDSSSAVPGQVTGLTATAGAASSKIINLAWAAPSGSPTSYNVMRGTSTSGPFLYIANTTELTFQDTTPASGTAYSYEVQAVNSNGVGAYSSIVTATSP